jgi:hypothetical protein
MITSSFELCVALNKTVEKIIMAFDYKKEYRELYLPRNNPGIVTVPKMHYIAVRGKGDPNEKGGEYHKSIELLYGIAYTLRMSYKGNYKIKGYFKYVVPPLEGFWWQDGIKGVDYTKKHLFNFISLIRLPDFITQKDFDWAIKEATQKKKSDFSKVEFFTYNEGLCVQCMHIGSYDSEPETTALMEKYANESGYVIDISNTRFHHEIYVGDPRKSDIDKLKTVIRHPIRKQQ